MGPVTRFALLAVVLSLAGLGACLGVDEPMAHERDENVGRDTPITPSCRGRACTVPLPETAWHPQPGMTWQWQLTGTVNTTYDVDAYDIDGFDNDTAVVDSIHDTGAKAICYISAGSWENWRSDAQDFPNYVKGRKNGWPGEKWLDIRQIDVLRPIMAKRMNMCVSKGFDAIEPDNIDGYANRTGFPLTYQDQLAYNRMLASEAHERGLAVALKNDTEQVPDLVGDFDFAVVEECYKYDECSAYSPFIKAGKPVLQAEYTNNGTTLSQFCPRSKRLGFSGILKRLSLGEWRRSCTT
jgi:hypothetical protein